MPSLSTKNLGIIRDGRGRVKIWQAPNALLYGWFLCKVVSLVFSNPTIKTGSGSVGTAFLFAWAYLELTQGINYFRRGLGGLVLAVIVIGYFRTA
ncbi:hypothetical protein BH09PAT3_BH09PAT3_6680 [soil metagenome]